MDVTRTLERSAYVAESSMPQSGPDAPVELDHTALPSMTPLLIEPTQHHPNGPQPLRDTCLNPHAWPTGWSRMSTFGNALWFWDAWTSDAEVSQCFANLRAAGKELAIAVGVLKKQNPNHHCQTAQACWHIDEPMLTRLAGLDPPPLTFLLDEPLTGSSLWGEPFDYALAVDQTGEWIALARAQFPTAKILLDEAYPLHDEHTLAAFFRDVNDEAIARTGWGIQYASVDHDWNAGGNLSGLVAMQEDARANGIGFAVIFWNASPSADWYDGLMFQGEMYQGWRWFELPNGQLVTLLPDLYGVRNWTGLPSVTVGETSADDRSFTNSVRDFVERFLPVASLPSNAYLYAWQSITSPDGRFVLTYQGDGNLVLRDSQSLEALWSSNTSGTTSGFTAMQGDGNLVVYDGAGIARWASRTEGNPGAFLVVQSDGNLVIYSDYTNWALWASNTDCC
jgi:hypothetical protein